MSKAYCVKRNRSTGRNTARRSIRAYVLKATGQRKEPGSELSRRTEFIKRYRHGSNRGRPGRGEIKYVAREPGIKTKVVVASNDSHVDRWARA